MPNEYYYIDNRNSAAVLDEEGSYGAMDSSRDSIVLGDRYGAEEAPVSSATVLWQSEESAEETMKREFNHLADVWERETEILSSLSQIVMHKAHLQIVAMGPNVVPLILDRMRHKPGLWFDALHFLTRQDPVAEAMRGDIDAMTEAWLEWGERNGFC